MITSRYELGRHDSYRERDRRAVFLVADDMSGLLVCARTKLEDGQLGTVAGRLDDPVCGDAEALVDVFLPVPVVEPGSG